MTVKFIHLRRRYPLWGTLEPTGGVTVAYVVDGPEVRYAYAICNPKDRYNKKIGRAVAGGRLCDPDSKAHSFKMGEGNIVEQIIQHHDSGLGL